MLGDLGRGGGGAPPRRECRGVVELTSDLVVRLIPRQREVTGADDPVVNDARDPRVNPPPLLPQVPVESRRQQRMGEANDAVVALDNARGDRGLERVCRNARPLQERFRRRPECRGERERLARGRGKPGETRADELVERLRHRERLERVDVHVKNADQLQGEERVPTRPLMDAEQCLAGERPLETVVEEPMQRADAERTYRQPLDALRGECALELRRLRSVEKPPSQQHEYTLRNQSSQRKRKRVRRGRVKPLNIVDGNQDRLRLAETVQHVAHRHGERAAIDGITRRLRSKQRDLERAPPRRRQRSQHVVADILEQISQPHVRQASLGLRRPRRKHEKASLACARDGRQPDRRFPDPRLALEYEPGGPLDWTVEERVDRVELLLPPCDVAWHHHFSRQSWQRGAPKSPRRPRPVSVSTSLWPSRSKRVLASRGRSRPTTSS